MGYPVPDPITGYELLCISFAIPDEPLYRAAFWGAVTELTHGWVWGEDQDLTDEQKDEIALMWIQALLDPNNQQACGNSQIPTPFWDTGDDLDDEATPATESWYGYVDDVDASPETIGFFESVSIWAITGLLAISGNVGAAILFNTTAPRFHLAMRAGDVGEIIRILFDAEEKAKIDTSEYTPGEVIRVPIVGDPDLTTHQLMIIKAG